MASSKWESIGMAGYLVTVPLFWAGLILSFVFHTMWIAISVCACLSMAWAIGCRIYNLAEERSYSKQQLWTPPDDPRLTDPDYVTALRELDEEFPGVPQEGV
jgi:hypothetical protein